MKLTVRRLDLKDLVENNIINGEVEIDLSIAELKEVVKGTDLIAETLKGAEKEQVKEITKEKVRKRHGNVEKEEIEIKEGREEEVLEGDFKENFEKFIADMKGFTRYGKFPKK